MRKTTFTREYTVLLESLRQRREQAGLTQAQLAKRLGEQQSFVSKCERGERRLDVVQLRVFCRALGMSLAEFVAEYEARLSGPKRR
ncbi:MAG: helix-turn-helix domain-containing protein [Pirellulales bacterium]|nr:helix-turn-helix domain-containing protein [Pirellulales bacterium]